MPEGLIFARQSRSLVPVADDSSEWLAKRKNGAPIILAPIQVRNVDRHRLYFVLCGLVAENHSDLTHKDTVDQAIRILTGHFDVVSWRPPFGRRVFIRQARSLSFANMSESDFEAFFDRALRAIETDLWPGVDIDALRKEAYVRSGHGLERPVG